MRNHLYGVHAYSVYNQCVVAQNLELPIPQPSPRTHLQTIVHISRRGGTLRGGKVKTQTGKLFRRAAER